MKRRSLVVGLVLLGLVAGMGKPLLAQPSLGVPFTYDCILWKEQFDPLPARAQRDMVSAIGSVVFAGVVAVIDLQKMLDLPFNPKMVVIGFFALGFVASLTDYWMTNERVATAQTQGVKLGCLPPEATY